MKSKIALKIVCDACGGEGLFVGACERDGCAVVCHHCKGTGCYDYKFEYEPFNKRKEAGNIQRVFQSSCGYVHSANDKTTVEGAVIKFSDAGCSYKDWLKGVKPKPVKDLYCPYQWTSQSLQTEDVNGLYKNRCRGAVGLGSWISECKFHKDKETCWKIFEGNQTPK